MPGGTFERDIPDPEGASDDGLVAVGGALDAPTLIAAYTAGIFPWSSDPVISWWSPDPRAIFDLATFRLKRSARQAAARAGWRFTLDGAFDAVIRACAEPGPGRERTWITDDFIAAYGRLHRLGVAHSVEVWEGAEGSLVGGLYGVAIGGFFGGESMFRRRTGASKAALGFLVERLRAGGFRLFDAQAPSRHLASLGATLIPRREYLARLRQAIAAPARLD